MKFIIDYNKKIIFGWSAKCGCSHIKKIYWFLQNNRTDNEIHTIKEHMRLPNNISDFTLIIITRNPFERIISGFLDKYKNKGQFRYKWKYNTLTFSNFVDELIKKNWKMVDKHHFTPQTSEYFNINTISQCKQLIVYDIKNINYEYIETLYNKKIPITLIEHRGVHVRKNYNENSEKKIYNLDINEYYNYNVSIDKFYNIEIINKILKFYYNDFIFLKQNGFDYLNYWSI